jgi:hypothetical protein
MTLFDSVRLDERSIIDAWRVDTPRDWIRINGNGTGLPQKREHLLQVPEIRIQPIILQVRSGA